MEHTYKIAKKRYDEKTATRLAQQAPTTMLEHQVQLHGAPLLREVSCRRNNTRKSKDRPVREGETKTTKVSLFLANEYLKLDLANKKEVPATIFSMQTDRTKD